MPDPVSKRPIFVAHRGASERYPENTIVAYKAAVDAGARFVELDVQLTSDRVPIVHHDVDLKRMTGSPGDITKTKSSDVLMLRASYSQKFGDKFASNPLATLAEFSHWLSQHKRVFAFVEIKRQSVDAFGVDETAKIVLDATKPIHDHCVVISFDDRVLAATKKQMPTMPIGWVLPDYNDSNLAKAKQLAPEYLFCKTTRVPSDRKVWAGPWKWALYNTDTVADAKDFYKSGFKMLETNRIVDMMASEAFSD